jgi:hypothetical protein
MMNEYLNNPHCSREIKPLSHYQTWFFEGSQNECSHKSYRRGRRSGRKETSNFKLSELIETSHVEDACLLFSNDLLMFLFCKHSAEIIFLFAAN